MVSLKHSFVSGKADGSDDTLVKPTDWNAEHNLTTTADGVVLGRAAGAGPGAVQELSMSSMFPTGIIMAWGGTSGAPPAGWVTCNGQLLVRVDYAALFAVISTVFNIGTVASTHFMVPDLRGRVIAGLDNMGGVAAAGVLTDASVSPNGVTRGARGGSETYTLSTTHMPAHNHDHNFNVSEPGHTHQFRIDDSGDYNTGTVVHPVTTWTSGPAQYAGTGSWLRTAAMMNQKAGVSMSGSISARGGGAAHLNLPPTLVMGFIIKT